MALLCILQTSTMLLSCCRLGASVYAPRWGNALEVAAFRVTSCEMKLNMKVNYKSKNGCRVTGCEFSLHSFQVRRGIGWLQPAHVSTHMSMNPKVVSTHLLRYI